MKNKEPAWLHDWKPTDENVQAVADDETCFSITRSIARELLDARAQIVRLQGELKTQLDHRAISDKTMQQVADVVGYRGPWIRDLPDAVKEALAGVK